MQGGSWLTEIRVRPDRRTVHLTFEDGSAFELCARLLRAMTPSAQDRGHGGPSFEPLTGLSPDMTIAQVALIGRYAVRIGFDDGHDSGLYTWDRLYRIGRERVVLEARLD